MAFSESKMVAKKGDVSMLTQSLKQKHPKNRKTKFFLKFDEAKREEFLTGFHKRKLERKQRAKEELKKQLEEEKKKRRHELRELRRNQKTLKCSQQIHSVEEMAPSKTFELPSHTVTLTDVTEVDFVGMGGLMLGTNKLGETAQVTSRSKEQTILTKNQSTKSTVLKGKSPLAKSKLEKKSHILKKKIPSKSRHRKKGNMKLKKKHKKRR